VHTANGLYQFCWCTNVVAIFWQSYWIFIHQTDIFLLLALQLFMSSGLLISSLPCFYDHSHLTPILYLSFSPDPLWHHPSILPSVFLSFLLQLFSDLLFSHRPSFSRTYNQTDIIKVLFWPKALLRVTIGRGGKSALESHVWLSDGCSQT